MRNPKLMLAAAVLASLVISACVATRPPAGEQASLTNTYWKLTLLDGTAVIKGARQTETHFILHVDDERVSGSGGCNRVMGSYKLDDRKLTFNGMASTRMACATGMQQEQDYLQALGKVAGWRIDGQKLVLLDAGGQAVANFEAVYLR